MKYFNEDNAGDDIAHAAGSIYSAEAAMETGVQSPEEVLVHLGLAQARSLNSIAKSLLNLRETLESVAYGNESLRVVVADTVDISAGVHGEVTVSR